MNDLILENDSYKSFFGGSCMRINRLAILCAAFGFASFLNFSAQAQITVDGTRDSGYGSALAVQTCGTSFGAGAGGSSLANAYAINDGTHLYLF